MPPADSFDSEIAIVGLAGRFPGAKNTDEFWKNLCEGVESIAFFDDDELEALDPAAAASPQYVKAGAVLEDCELFDASFFGYNPREAELMDPQQRLFLECAWEALERAGYTSDRYTPPIGIYAGVGMSTYLLFNLYSNRDVVESAGFFQTSIANKGDFLTTRVSYKLNLRGPSVNVQTACSTSLVAVHLACQSLLNGECDMALAGGVSISFPQKAGYLYQEGGILSPDGHCRAFDAEARGTVGGSGAGIVVLKRLADAVADGDSIHAVIKGSAINNDGFLKVGYTAPSVEGQAKVIAEALAISGVSPETITYVEAHGTATPLGDPIEIAALTQVFREHTQRKGFCAVGSVKTNIGHLDAAAGIAGLIKAVLALEHGLLPPSLHFHTPNPQIDFANSPFYMQTALAEWKPAQGPRRAGVSSFGMGGTNAHIVLEEAPQPDKVTGGQGDKVTDTEDVTLSSGHLVTRSPAAPISHDAAGLPVSQAPPAPRPALLVLSAKTPSALEAATANLAAHLAAHPEQSLADVAYTLQVGRASFDYRRMLVCRDRDDALHALESQSAQRILSGHADARDRPVVFMFPGQGDHYVQMARQLYQAEPSFRAHVDRCAALFAPHLGLDLRDVLYPGDGRTATDGRDKVSEGHLVTLPPCQTGVDLRAMLGRAPAQPDAAQELLNQTALAQPALFTIEYALAQLWMEWGVHPGALIGYSLGEYVAACLAGVFSLEDAAMLVARRARMIQSLPEGAMLAVPLSEQDIRPLLDEQLCLAAINGPSMCVLAGPLDAVAALERRLATGGTAFRRLATSHAVHSRMMEPIVEPFVEFMRGIKLSPPTIPYLSNLTGTWITAAEAADPRYWARHLCETVRLASGIGELWQEPGRIFLEVGPGHALGSLALQHPSREGIAEPVVLPSLRHAYEQQHDLALLLSTLGQLWLAGVEVDWPRLYAHERRVRLALPTYPFERKPYWISPRRPAAATGAESGPIVRKPDIADWFYLPAWKQSAPARFSKRGAWAAEGSRWCVFVDSQGLGAQLVRRLEARHQEVITVMLGQGFARVGDGTYTIDPRRREDYDALLQELRLLQKLPGAIVHLWSLVPNNLTRAGAAFFEEAQALGFYSLLFLAQAYASQNIVEPLQISVVSSGTQAVTGDETLCPELATLQGLCSVIPQEYPQITCRTIDLLSPDSDRWPEERLLDQLVAELDAVPADLVVAYRGDRRWAQAYENVRLDDAAEGHIRWRAGGVYLIAGGLDDVGYALAAHLAETLRARLAFVEGAGLPARAEWQQWLATHGEQDRASLAIRRVQGLEALGSEVLILSIDATDVAQMRAAIAQVYDRFGELHGALYVPAATGASFATIAETTYDEARRHIWPTVQGAYALEQALQGRSLDFCLLLSSLSTVLGGVGLASYAAANAFLDALARERSSGAPWVSVNWDRAIAQAEAVSVFQRIVSLLPSAQIVLSTHDLAASIDTWIKRAAERDTRLSADTRATPTLHARPNLRNAYAAPSNEAERLIADIWQALLGIEQVGIHDNFFQLGGDSLLGVQLSARLRHVFQVDVPTRVLFEAPTVAQLALAIEDMLIAELEQLSGETQHV